MAAKMNAGPREGTVGFQCWRLISDLPNQRSLLTERSLMQTSRKIVVSVVYGKKSVGFQLLTVTVSTQQTLLSCSPGPVVSSLQFLNALKLLKRLYFNGCSINHVETCGNQGSAATLNSTLIETCHSSPPEHGHNQSDKDDHDSAEKSENSNGEPVVNSNNGER